MCGLVLFLLFQVVPSKKKKREMGLITQQAKVHIYKKECCDREMKKNKDEVATK